MDLLLRRRMLIDKLSAASDPYLLQPYTITFTSANKFWIDATLFNESDFPITSLYLKLNDGPWTAYDIWDNVFSGFLELSVSSGDILQIKATGRWGISQSQHCIFSVGSSSDRIMVSGNIMSLIAGDNFASATVVPDFAFYSLFYDSSYYFNQCCTDYSNLRLPATTLGERAYSSLFAQARFLTDASVIDLPAMTIPIGCYSGMFANNSSLVTAPYLRATTLSNYSYQTMFMNCTSLVNVQSELPVTTLGVNCCRQMYQGCSKLTTAPALLAETLVTNCYYRMFYNCSKLNYIKAMFTTTPSTTYCNNWVNGVKATGTFVKNSAATWNVTGTSGVPSGWTVQTASS